MAFQKRRLKVLPYRDEAELIEIRGWFYPSETSIQPGSRRDACEKVKVWSARCRPPLEVEATALLTEAILHDDFACSDEGSLISMEAVRATYATALSRFVTLLADVKQDKRHKINMYDIGKDLGMPAAFIDLRHRITHYDLPPLEELRENAPAALMWLRERYWDGLDNPSRDTATSDRGQLSNDNCEDAGRVAHGPTRALDEFDENGIRTFRSMKAILEAATAHIATFKSDTAGADTIELPNSSDTEGNQQKVQDVDISTLLKSLDRPASVWIPTPFGTINR